MRAGWLLPVVALGLAGCVAQHRDGRRMVEPGARYVAMGSSFAAGAAIGPNQPGSPARCSRSVNNYPSLLAARLGLALDDRTCGGATTAHVLGPWNELPAQIEAVDSETRLVTLTIGGNDLNYAGNLFMSSCQPGRIYEVAGYKIPCTAPVAPPEENYVRLEKALRQIVREVQLRAPSARIVLVQYVSLLPHRPCAATAMPLAYVKLSRDIGNRLASITARIARETGALLLPVDRLSRYHTACDPDPWSNGMTGEIDLSKGAPWHPNVAGHEAIAAELAQALSKP